MFASEHLSLEFCARSDRSGTIYTTCPARVQWNMQVTAAESRKHGVQWKIMYKYREMEIQCQSKYAYARKS